MGRHRGTESQVRTQETVRQARDNAHAALVAKQEADRVARQQQRDKKLGAEPQ